MTFGGEQKLSLQHRMKSHLEHCSNMFCTAVGARIYGGPMLSALVKKAIILLPSYHHCILKLVKTIAKKTSNKDSSHRSLKKANSLSKLKTQGWYWVMSISFSDYREDMIHSQITQDCGTFCLAFTSCLAVKHVLYLTYITMFGLTYSRKNRFLAG